MKFRWDKKYLAWGITAFLVVVCSILFYFLIFRMDSLAFGLKKIYSILTPLVYGAAISYLLCPLVNFMEKSVILRICRRAGISVNSLFRKIVRMVCVILSLVFAVLCIYGLIAMLVPEIINSLMNIINNSSRYLENMQVWLSDVLKDNPDLEASVIALVTRYSSKLETWLTSDFLPQLNQLVLNFSTGLFDFLVFLKNLLIGAIISIYMLYNKEAYLASSKKGLYSIVSTSTANNIIRDFQYVHKTFGGFIIGKIIDSLIIGILCYIGTTILGTPYALLVSVIVGVTNVIPFFGPYLGAVPSAFLILLVNPLQCVYFVIFIVVLQQFDGNFLGPKILGESTGMSSFMVIVAILIFGGFFGIFGMFVGVPIFAVILTIIQNSLRRRLERAHLPADREFYKNIDHIDETTLKPVYPGPDNTINRDEVLSYRADKKKKTDKEEQKKS